MAPHSRGFFLVSVQQDLNDKGFYMYTLFSVPGRCLIAIA